jgi:hypothetical protein
MVEFPLSEAKVFTAVTPKQDVAPVGASAKNLHTLRGSIFRKPPALCSPMRGIRRCLLSVFFAEILLWATACPFMASETELTIPAPLRHKKKSDVMRTIGKIGSNRQRRKREQNPACLLSFWSPKRATTAKQESTKTSPIGIIWSSLRATVVIVSIVAGFSIWGVEFVWVVLGLVFCWRIIKGIASCLVSLICLIGFFWFIFTHIF